MKKNLFILPLVALLSSCALFGPLVSNFDQNSVDAALTLKVEASTLVPKGFESASLHTWEIDSLKSKLEAQVAYEKGKGQPNHVSAKQWEILASKDHDLLGKFLNEWKGDKKFSRVYCREKSEQIDKAFDEILNAESSKPK